MPVPAPLTRRQVLQTASLLGISAVSLSIPSDAVAVESPDHSLSPQSGLVTKQLKPLKYEEIPGLLTKSQVTPHYQAHYGGALKRFVTLDQQLDTLYKGWGILARDLVNGQLYNVASDLHEVGVLWLGQSLIVCDVYEHAFYVDYQNRKPEYVNKFAQFLDWTEIDRRWNVLK